MRGILTYHSIDDSGSPISVSPAAFAAHVRTLAQGKVRVEPLERLADLPASADAVAITFDDGFESFARHAWPLLRDHGFPATLFVVSDRVGATNAWEAAPGLAIPTLPLLGWEDLGRLAAEGLTLGAHGRTHASLPGLPPHLLADEVAGSREAIRAKTGVAPSAFAYPFGDFDSASTAAARAAFRCAVTTRFALLGEGDDRHLLPRIDAYYLRANDRLAGFGTAGFRRWLSLRGAVRRAGTAARGVRRARPLGKAARPPILEVPNSPEGDAADDRRA